MTITVITKGEPIFPLTEKDMKDGLAYQDEEGYVYICNRINDIAAASVCGQCVLFEGNSTRVREVNLKIEVSFL